MASIDKLTLSRELGDRFRLFLLSSFTSGFMCFMVAIMFEWKPLGIAEHLIHAIGLEVFVTFSLFGLLGLVWALFAPRWLERLVHAGFNKVIAVIMAVGVTSIVCVVVFLAAQ